MNANKRGHIDQLIDNLHEVQQLMQIHEQVAGPGRGRKHNVEVLNKGAIVLLVACWESFAEDLCRAALEELIAEAADPSVMPDFVLTRIGNAYKGDQVWKLAGEGWKQALKDNLIRVLEETTDKLNNPKPFKVDKMFKEALGVEKLSDCWRWRGNSADDSRSRLTALVELRGAIAHRVKHSKPVQKKAVLDAVDLVTRLAEESHNYICGFLAKRTGKKSWNRVVRRVEK